MDRSADEVELSKLISGAIITMWGFIGLLIISYEITNLLNGVSSLTLARFTLNTGIIFGGLGILMKKFMGYVLAVFLIGMKIVVDILTQSYFSLGIDIVLFMAVVTMYISE